jgi:hypothetical protein
MTVKTIPNLRVAVLEPLSLDKISKYHEASYAV